MPPRPDGGNVTSYREINSASNHKKLEEDCRLHQVIALFAAAVPVEPFLEQIHKALGMHFAVIWQMPSFPFQFEKRIRNSSRSHEMNNNIHLQFHLGATLTVLPFVII